MATARHIIERAFSKIGIRAAETPLQASEIEDGRDVLNDLLKSWDATGTLKGVPPVDDVENVLEAPPYSHWALKANVAILLAGEYGIVVSQAIANDAVKSLAEMVKASINLRDIKFPSTLPRGSGNSGAYRVGYEREFFAEDDNPNF
jgi:hypothetical protein